MARKFYQNAISLNMSHLVSKNVWSSLYESLIAQFLHCKNHLLGNFNLVIKLSNLDTDFVSDSFVIDKFKRKLFWTN